MKYTQYEFTSRVWIWAASDGWHFVSLPKDMSEHITARFGDRARGWGSLPVTVTVGATSWNTSIFPDKKHGFFVLPLKATVRKKENISVDQRIKVLIEIRV